MEHGPVLGGVDVPAGEHGVPALLDAGPPGHRHERGQRLVGHPVLGVVEGRGRRRVTVIGRAPIRDRRRTAGAGAGGGPPRSGRPGAATRRWPAGPRAPSPSLMLVPVHAAPVPLVVHGRRSPLVQVACGVSARWPEQKITHHSPFSDMAIASRSPGLLRVPAMGQRTTTPGAHVRTGTADAPGAASRSTRSARAWPPLPLTATPPCPAPPVRQPSSGVTARARRRVTVPAACSLFRRAGGRR